MIEEKLPRTRLEQLLRQRHLTLEQFVKNYNGSPTSIIEGWTSQRLTRPQ